LTLKNANLDNGPHLVFWELTGRCNLRCRHCRGGVSSEFQRDELTTEEILRAAGTIREHCDPIIVLTGGEPLVRDDIFHIAQACSKLFTHVALATNGTLVDNETAGRIADSGIARVGISIDGATAKTHDALRGLPGSFDAAISGFDALKRAGVSVQVNATLTRYNDTELDDLLALAVARGADAFHLFMFVPVGCGAVLADELRVSPRRAEERLEWLFEQSVALQSQLHIRATCAPQYFRIMNEVSSRKGIAVPGGGHGMQASTRGCLAGSGVCFISRTGDIQPCGYLPIHVGNVREHKFGEIWRRSEIFQALRDPDRLGGKCSLCEYRTICGGCRARAYALTGDFLTEDPDCTYHPTKLRADEPR